MLALLDREGPSGVARDMLPNSSVRRRSRSVLTWSRWSGD